LTQLHDDLGALLDASLTRLGDAPTISGAIDNQIIDRFNPALGAPADRLFGVLVIWLDPVVADLESSSGRVTFNPRENSYSNSFLRGYVNVAGNAQVVVIPFVRLASAADEGGYRLNVDSVPGTARGG